MDILDKYVRRGRRTASRIWGETGMVLFLPGSKSQLEHKTFELSSTGIYFWKLLESKPKLREIVDSIAQKKRIRYDIALREVVRQIKKLSAKGIVDIVDKPE